EEPGLGELPLHRADHAGGAVLSGDEPGLGRIDPDRRAPARQDREALMATTVDGQARGAGNQPMVRCENVCKQYGPLVVLDELDLDVAANEKVAIIGPSGSGKTTVLRMLMTLERIDGGVIWVDGEPLTHMERNGKLVPADAKHIRRVRSKIGMVFQSFNLFPHMTAMKNCIEAPITVLGLSRKEAEERAAELLDM